MRRAATKPEQRMWLALRAKRFGGVKFRRQKVIGPYIVDFAARDPMLVIEIDGDTHGSQQGYDTARTAYLEREGYRVARFTNAEVMGNLEGVLTLIDALICTPPLPTHSPEGGRAQ
jgi:very-short-patch-repair endonuclease